MKRIIRLTENDLTRIVRRVINEQQDDELRHTEDEMKDFSELFSKKTVNFYLPGDRTIPIIPQFYINDHTFSDNVILLKGTTSVGDINLSYRCDGTNLFSVYIKKFDNKFLDDVAQSFDTGINNQWKMLLEKYIDLKTRTLNKVGNDLSKERSKLRKELYNKYPRPLVEGGMDKTGQDLIKYIQNYLCSFNKEGNPVIKATYSSTGTQKNQNLS